MSNRFRTDVTRVPAVRIGVARGGLTTTIAWDGSPLSSAAGKSGRRGGLATIGDPRLAGPLPTDRHLIPGTRTDFGTGDVSRMTSSGLESFKGLLLAAGARRREITADLGKARWQLRLAWTMRALGWATMTCAVAPVRRAASRSVALRRREVATLGANLEATPVRVDFDMDSEVGAPQRRMQEAFERILACRSRWSILHTQMIDRVKARSAAGTIVNRRPASMGRGADPLVATGDPPLAVEVQNGAATAYFYPGFVLVARRDGGDFALVDLADLEVRGGSMRFNETEGVPADAQVVGASWAKSNKDGSRDRRFADNSQIPVALYGELHLRGPGGLHESFMTSKVEPCEAFAGAVRELRQVLASGRAIRNVAARNVIADGRSKRREQETGPRR